MKNLLVLSLALMSLASFGAGKDVEYTHGEQAYLGYYAEGKADKALVILLHDWDGLTDYEKTRADMLAKVGYSVFAADLFGKDVRPTTVADKRKCTTMLSQDRPQMRALMQAALEAARAQGANQSHVVVMGYCFGGTAALEWARSGADLAGFASFHGGLTTPEGQTYAKTKGHVLIFHGSADSMITMDHFAGVVKEMEEHKVSHEAYSYGGAPHSFTKFGSKAYREKADTLSWARFLQYINSVGK